MDPPHVLITGGSGFLGTSIISALLNTTKYTITALDISLPPLGTQTFSSNPRVRYTRCDILDVPSLSKVFAETKPTAVIHTAAIFHVGTRRYSMKDRDAVFKVNVEGTRNVLEASKEHGVKAFVYTSSITVLCDDLSRDFKNADETWPLGKVDTSYGQSKALAESLVLTSNSPSLATTALRSAPIFGPTDRICIPTIHACIDAGQTPFILGPGTNLQDYVYVDNVAHAHVLAVRNLLVTTAAERTAAGEAMFISNDEPVTARALCLAIWREFGHVPKFEVQLPVALARCMGIAAEWTAWATGQEPNLSRGMVSEGCRDCYVSVEKAKRLIGYEVQVGLDEGIKISCREYRERLEARKRPSVWS
ncbi:hypothetical protein COCC4DRAFT_71421 [Bipolaris maydis ATCC 48331]|uniref:3-beta hydroxysteroid dehydrogenase/isomerase domain-containing protein n=2 Tax=Cochliobolus heterostrophus TaxID=5016 RepID=M2T0T5_COCH5|nr:uncharacterized protein COCC4DRAFT_71421 [Bipolaris maydis ATCC 48331]EMD91215.1 hypothetical protein COCHEDRAFT_1177140 [Bipolaris maydis C5]KAJ5022906.1 hypothetical protein J3E73DRAFT_434216 [Bipolaris maydis]ENI05704.1 hypothetical protein COCC4DRAFT_71421 [Bipolaris maydis ATCC 48331]KAJ5064407.1 C-3 sterol dehydrogenase/C-4 decarboxylase-like protein [Bipolaris maydis]KAJ6193575.1 C-3 sterol dehydrogenase/C-4 decarboxylase-like protein [Bipolaris maydis]